MVDTRIVAMKVVYGRLRRRSMLQDRWTMKAFLFDDEQGSLLKWLDTVIEDYELSTTHLGKNMREQLEIVMGAMTG